MHGNSYTKFVLEDIKSRFTCGKSSLYCKTESYQNIMTSVAAIFILMYSCYQQKYFRKIRKLITFRSHQSCFKYMQFLFWLITFIVKYYIYYSLEECFLSWGTILKKKSILPISVSDYKCFSHQR